MSQIPLTALTHGGGCACKLSAAELRHALQPLSDHPALSDPSLLVGIGTSDDAGVWLLDDDTALVQTVDFFTPVVDDPYDWGRIAAANALSDLYAMGATPLTALQLLGWPRGDLETASPTEAMRGGADTMVEAGCVVVGGHSIDSTEPLYGFAVTGIAAPAQLITNSGARPGDKLILTKPLGTGIITTAIKRGVADRAAADAAVTSMTALNADTSKAMLEVGVNAATDVTGFGLLGHLHEMLVASGVGARLTISTIPALTGAMSLAAHNVFPAGSARNLAEAEGYTTFSDTPIPWRRLLADAQTSGGLLASVPADHADTLVACLSAAGSTGTVIGLVTTGAATITVGQ